MGELDRLALFHGAHECVGDGDRNVEIAEPAVIFRVDERFDIRMIAAQYAHLRAAPRTG